MIAIAIVAVMSSGISGAQTSLETTLAREEVDTQAEALRFIQSAYIADKNSDTQTDPDTQTYSGYSGIWKTITARAIPSEGYENFKGIINSTASCNAAYNESFFNSYAFIINPSDMSVVTPIDPSSVDASGKATFTQATTYPRLIGNSSIGSDNLVDSLTSQRNGISRVEGLFVFAVQDQNSTTITDIIGSEGGSSTNKKSAFYDFYIRACWYGTGDEIATNVSTVIRLYDPDATAISSYATGEWVSFNGIENSRKFYNGEDNSMLDCNEKLQRNGFICVGWNRNPFADSGVTSYTPPNLDNVQYNNDVIYYPIWEHIFIFNANGGEWSDHNGSEITYKFHSPDSYTYTLSVNNPNRTGYTFVGWCPADEPIGTNETCGENNERLLQKDGKYTIDSSENAKTTTTFYAVWETHPDTVFLIDSSRSMETIIGASREALIQIMAQTTTLQGKVALFDYSTFNNRYNKSQSQNLYNKLPIYDQPPIGNYAKMLCGFEKKELNIYSIEEGKYKNYTAEKCTNNNINNLIESLKNLVGGEDLPYALNYVLDSLNGNWTAQSNYMKTIIIITDETVEGGMAVLEEGMAALGWLKDTDKDNYLEMTSFFNKVKEENLTPLNIYIVGPEKDLSNNNVDLVDSYKNIFCDHSSSLNIIRKTDAGISTTANSACKSGNINTNIVVIPTSSSSDTQSKFIYDVLTSILE